ncbi:ABC transporter permease [Sphingomonas sp. CARO-RG-8B-R24-01]|uniref:ABC transporter permease n=1 Tax=Sphingomonas sp. CARO-RG-8B-R24-01 TaxID=2914831 RepID=UPI001F56C938|nr:ABC transporter permease [Sphingomonas sp. CARO-RG-8B-R24-01]
MPSQELIEATRRAAAEEALAAALRHMAAGEHQQARATLEAALAQIGEQKDLLAQLALLQAAAGDQRAAIATLHRQSAIAPLEAEQHAFLGFEYLAAYEPELGEVHLQAAVSGAPDNAVYRTALVQALMQLGQARAAVGAAMPALRHGAVSGPLLHAVFAATMQLERPRLAGQVQRRVLRLHPDDPAIRFGMAHAFLANGQDAAAFDLLSDLPDHDDAELWFLRSVALAQGKRFEESFVAIERAIALAPAERGYLRHAVAVLGQLARHSDAAAFLDTLTDSDPDGAPDDEAWLRGVFATYTAAGRYDRAITVGARLVQMAPDDIDFLSVYETVISKHLYARLINSKPNGAPAPDRPARAPTQGRIRPASFLRSCSALFRRELKTRFGRSRAGYLWVLFEPLAHIGIMIFLIGMLNHGGLPPMGQSFAVFYFTGIIPYHIFTHTAGHLIGSVPENRPLLQIPRVRILDIFAARAILEALTELIVATIFLSAFLIVGMDAMPLEPLAVVGALLLLWVAALGVGMISAAIVSVFPGWERIWGALASIIYFSSGTFYVPRMMPIWIRDILVWNPVLQGIELVRFHYFHEPAPEWLSVGYLAGFAIGAVTLALILERVMRRRMLDVE